MIILWKLFHIAGERVTNKIGNAAQFNHRSAHGSFGAGVGSVVEGADSLFAAGVLLASCFCVALFSSVG
jgi:hypothetical protein